MTLLDAAIDYVRRGWHIFPCIPKTKVPLAGLAPHGFKSASADEETIRRWWTIKPEANIGISTGPSDLTVIDCDHGHATREAAVAWLARVSASGKLPRTYTVLTGRRFDSLDPSKPEWGVQLYYQGAIPGSGHFELDGGSGDVQSIGDLVMGASSIHPKSGEAYAVLIDAPVAPLPEWVRTLAPKRRTFAEPVTVPDDVADEWKAWLLEYAEHCGLTVRDFDKRVPNGWWLGIRCPWEHRSGDGSESSTVLGILDGKIAFECSHGTCKTAKHDTAAFKAEMLRLHGEFQTEPGAEPSVMLGTGLPMPQKRLNPADWHDRYMTAEAFENVKPPEFLIADFLVKNSITMLAGPVAQRKSIIALNIAHALCTGDPLFGYFDVTAKPVRTVYLCPEMGAASFAKRIKQIGIGKYVGETLFIQTMSEQPTTLDELENEVPEAVVIVDTITRFVEGDENKVEDMRRFAQKVFRLANAGATVLLLHHSKKGSTGSLDDGLRGSSELAAFVDSCWVTELEDTKKPYDSLSKMRNVKQRDFEIDPFRVKPTPGSYYLTMEGEPEPEAVLKSKKDDAAREALAAILNDSPKMGIHKLIDALKAKGHGRGAKWVTRTRGELLGTGATYASD
ncbi:bifunctional DNA primase/polymerase [Terracidiphilus gabretensis]|uniref:bifunctional DNA primase/polymerase n=1 Tax=Terracidiphilus gabretensis TaxID=1577687 RepID=UPI00071BF53D|nr:bifunctional DNA primase/polymerase [Terracidiphilus gabretensis]